MSPADSPLLRQLLKTFREEAHERIASMQAKLAELEQASDGARAAAIEVAFREAHSLKAAAGAIEQIHIQRLCQAMESIFQTLKQRPGPVPPAFLRTLVAGADGLEEMVATLDGDADPARLERATALTAELNDVLSRPPAAEPTPPPARPPAAPVPAPPMPVPPPAAAPAAASKPATPPTTAAQPAAAPPAPAAPVARSEEESRGTAAVAQAAAAAETVRLSVQRLDALLLQAEDMLSDKLALQQLARDLGEAGAELSAWAAELTRAQASEAGAREQVRNAERRLAPLRRSLQSAGKLASAGAHDFGVKVDRLRLDMKQLLLVQCATQLQLFPRAVRELARDQGKEVEFEIRGGDLQMDRRILEAIKDPLLHLVRNAVDHGIEMPADRQAAGKPARATLTLTIAATDANKVEFVVADDGRGIDTAKLAATAVRQGVLREDEAAAAPEAELTGLIFHSGLSTAPIITDLSGRGLGMAIVRERVEQLGGTVLVETERGRGTRFRLVLPLTLSTQRGITVRVGDRRFVFPTLGVERAVVVEADALSTVENRPMLSVQGTGVPLVALSDVLEMPPASTGSAGGEPPASAIVLGGGDRRVAFGVDAVEGDQEILLKPLGRCLVRVRNVQGATILANGEVAPVLNLQDLLRSAARGVRPRLAAPAGTVPATAAAGTRRRILIAEDSITARGLLKHILEAADYEVATAADGMDAWTQLKLEGYDLLVSDVEMPGINGFELTRRVRTDARLKELPVILVTALESREDLARGVDAGANAYITKGTFQQVNLLETIRRLL